MVKGASLSKYIYDANTYGTIVGNEQLLKQWVFQNGTISVCIYVSAKFKQYQSGN